MKNKLFKTCLTGLALSVAGLAYASPESLGSASPFTVLSTSGAVNCTNSTIEGDVGSAVAGTKTGCSQIGDVFTPVSSDIQADFITAYSALADEQCGNYLTTLAGQTLAPGTYCVDQASTNTGGVLTLDGNLDDTWLFKIGSSGAGALTGTDFVVEMSGAADACNVTWWVADAVTLTRGDFKGDILSGKAVTVTGVAPNSPLKGRVMANGNVVLTNADALGCVAEAAARTEEAIAAALAAKQAAEASATVALLAVVNDALDVVIGLEGRAGLIGDTGPTGPAGAAGTNGAAGAVGGIGNTGAKGDTGTDGAPGADGAAGLEPFIWNVPPTAANSDYLLGKVWIDTSGPTAYILVKNSPNAAVWNVLGGSAPGGTLYAIGDAGPAGGVVFHVTDGGLHGLEAAALDQRPAPWGCYGTPISGANGTAVGTGEQNTIDIMAGCNETTAASVAAAYGPGWYLPSKVELDRLYVQKDVVRTLAGGNYWSSSQYDGDIAWSKNLWGNGPQSGSLKDETFFVRAIRSF
jgi:hypothetical protein